MNGANPSPTAILVLGMHRGGTSALAGTLHKLGFECGPSVMPAVEGVNRKGFWEHLDAFRIHERLFAAFGRSSFDPREMPAGWRDHPEFQSAVNDVQALVARDFSAASHWFVKDPRLCKFAPVWLEALQRLGIQPRVLLIARHPGEIARSMRDLGWCESIARSHLCWLQYMFEAERATRGVPRACIGYADLLGDWRTEIARAGRLLGVDWPQRERAESDVDEFLDASERHYAHPPEDAQEAELPALVRDLHEVFAKHAAAADVWERIAELGRIYRLGEAVFAPCLDQSIVDLALTRLAMEQQRASLAHALRGEAVAVRWRGADGSDCGRTLAPASGDLRGGGVGVQWDVQPDGPCAFLRVELGTKPGVFTIRGMRIDGVAVDDLASRIVSASSRMPADGGAAIVVVGLRGGAWLELDLQGLLPDPAGGRSVHVELELQRETDTAELASFIACAVDEALASRSGQPR
jgi:hypothetical protein